MRSFFDTNVVVYLFDDDAPEKKAKAQALLEDEVSEGRAVLSTQVLQEFYVATTTKLSTPLPPNVAEQAVRDLALLPLTLVDAQLVLGGITRSRDLGFSFWDGLIVETALASGAKRLFTEDLQDGQEIDGLRIENPFA